MIRLSQSVRQSQTLQQRLSPQQIQYIKLLQLPTLQLEQRIKQEIEVNPVLELDASDTLEQDLSADDTDGDGDHDIDGKDDDAASDDQAGPADDIIQGDASDDDAGEDIAAIDDTRELDWETYFRDDDSEYIPAYKGEQDDWKDIPRPYNSGLHENLERQVELLDLDEREQKLAAEIIGSVDPDGYLRRELDAIIDAVAFSEGYIIANQEAEKVLHQIQRLDPPGIAARDLRECLLVQLEVSETRTIARDVAMEILDKTWSFYKKKHYAKILRKLNITEEQLRQANHVIMMLDPKPGESEEYLNPDQFVIPDFEVFHEESGEGVESESGDLVIRMHQKNMPQIKISRHYKEMWDSLASRKRSSEDDKTLQFIKDKMDSARWFIESIQQRKNTLMSVMQTIVALQERFFRTGKGLRPMILKDVADRIGMDISTVSRVVNGKYVQTSSGVLELKYFFTEGMETESGESVSNREIKNILGVLVRDEDKRNPLSDQALACALADKGYPVARRTISKYRELMGIPVARMRKGIG